jgi:hypothetical protein
MPGPGLQGDALVRMLMGKDRAAQVLGLALPPEDLIQAGERWRLGR